MPRGSPGKNSNGLGARLPLAVRAAGPSLSFGSSTSAEQPAMREVLAQVGAFLRAEVPFVNVLADGLAGHSLAGWGERAHALELTQDRVDAPRPMHVLHVVSR